MRRIIVLALGTVIALTLALPAQAASGVSHHYTDVGLGAEAQWTTFPASGKITPGVVYTDTYLNTSRDAVLWNGTNITDSYASVDEFSYMFDAAGNFIYVSDVFGFSHGSRVSLVVDSKLASASLSARLRLVSCSASGTCTDLGRATLSGSWTAITPKALSNGTFVFHAKGITDVSHQHGFSRGADATGQVSNLASLGNFQYADIFDVTYKDMCTGSC